MAPLGNVTLLMAENVSSLELARDIFTSEIRRFVKDVLESTRLDRSEPWTNGRVRVDLPREIDTEARFSAYMTSQFALARAELRFRRDARYIKVAELPFGIVFDEAEKAFTWCVRLVPMGKYPLLDDAVWNAPEGPQKRFGGAVHQHATNTIRFVSRPVNASLSTQQAYADTKAVSEFLLELADPLGKVIDVAPTDGEGASEGDSADWSSSRCGLAFFAGVAVDDRVSRICYLPL